LDFALFRCFSTLLLRSIISLESFAPTISMVAALRFLYSPYKPNQASHLLTLGHKFYLIVEQMSPPLRLPQPPVLEPK
jgi:hypothetical protein